MTQIPIPNMGSKIGFNNNIGTGNFAILSNASVTDPTGEQARIISTSVNDTDTGTGVQKVRIVYFDNNWNLHEEIITTNGISPVLTTATDILRIESFEVFKTGSNIFAAGNISLRSTDATRLFAQIDSGRTIFERALHFISPGKVGNIIDIILNCPTSGGVFFIIFKEKDNTANQGGIVLIPDIMFAIVSGGSQISLQIPVICDASQSIQGLRIGVATRALSAGQIASASFHFNET